MRTHYQGICLDLMLILWAALFPWHPLEDWLLRHTSLVYWTMGSLHVVALPWLVLWMMATMDLPPQPSQHRALGPETGLLNQVFGYSFVLYFVCSWMNHCRHVAAVAVPSSLGPAVSPGTHPWINGWITTRAAC